MIFGKLQCMLKRKIRRADAYRKAGMKDAPQALKAKRIHCKKYNTKDAYVGTP